MSADRSGLELLQRLDMIGQIMPDAEDLEAYIEASIREETVGPLFYPDVMRRAEKRMRAGTDLCRAALKYRKAFAKLQEAAAEESDPEADAAAAVLHRRFHERYLSGDDS